MDNLDKSKTFVLQDSRKYIPVSLVEKNIEDLNKEEQEIQDSISDEEREEYKQISKTIEQLNQRLIEIKNS